VHTKKYLAIFIRGGNTLDRWLCTFVSFGRKAFRSIKVSHLHFGFVILVLSLTSCLFHPNTHSSQIQIQTDQRDYAPNDSITLKVANDSTVNYNVGLRCGEYLEMYFQRQKNGEWSEKQRFWYMSLKCYTKLDALLPGESYQTIIPADWLKGSGTFRLDLAQHHSNPFTIE